MKQIRRRIVQAPTHVREAVHAILVEHMAAYLARHHVDLHDPIACKVALIEAGHGEASVARLLDRAVEAAACRHSHDD